VIFSVKKDREYAKKIAELFWYEDVDIEKSIIEFAKLTHHKNVLRPLRAPVLTLGTIVKLKPHKNSSNTTQEQEFIDDFEYFVCIQQKCDSVRLGEKKRRFLFLPLRKRDNAKLKERYIIIGKEIYGLDSNTYELKTIQFQCASKGDSVVKAKEDKETKEWYFSSIYGEKIIWCFDLKEVHALRIAHEYSSKLSRIGLDESEWLRNLGQKK